jgi:hypothetical protein
MKVAEEYGLQHEVLATTLQTLRPTLTEGELTKALYFALEDWDL